MSGSEMAKAADATGIQYRRLNMSRGPAVRSTRCQSDSALYKAYMSDVILNDAGITPVEGGGSPEYEPTHITGLRLKSGEIIKSRAVVITTGTFEWPCRWRRAVQRGRVDAPASFLSTSLQDLGCVSVALRPVQRPGWMRIQLRGSTKRSRVMSLDHDFRLTEFKSLMHRLRA